MATCIDYIFLEAGRNELIDDVALRFGNSDHLLLECTLKPAPKNRSSQSWRFDKNCLENGRIKKEVIAELENKEATEDWDMCKLTIQSIIRAFRQPKPPEKKIEILNKKIVKLKQKVASGRATETTLRKIEEINMAAELAAENLCRRSKARWIEKGERSTKYFYAHYKAKKAVNCLDSVKIPELDEHTDTLEYIRDFYEELYKSEEICQESFREITSDLPQVDDAGNKLITQKITREEILQTILSLPNNKSPGTDGITYEFYKIFADKIAPVLEVFNKVLSKGKMPLSWHKNMIVLIPKKEENLEEIGN